MATDQSNESTSLELTERRGRELAEAIERSHASDKRRIQSVEISQTDLFWFSEETVKRAGVRWPDNYRAKG